MAFSWRFKKQFLYSVIFFVIILAIIGFFVLRFMSGGTCFDNKQNQNEEGTDCGGNCKPCQENIKELTVLWKRFFAAGENAYETAAVIENPNLIWGIETLNYKFKLYDQNNILIAVKGGTTFLNPNDRIFIFEPKFDIKERRPHRATIEFDDIKWKFIEKMSPNLIVIKKDFYDRAGLSILEVEVKNNSLENVENIYVGAALLDENENAFAASQTKIDKINPEGSGKAVFTWGQIFQQKPAKIDIFIKTKIKY